MDVTSHGDLKWANVTTDISISQYNTISIAPDQNQTENHFGEGIRGIADSLIMGFKSMSNLYTE